MQGAADFPKRPYVDLNQYQVVKLDGLRECREFLGLGVRVTDEALKVMRERRGFLPPEPPLTKFSENAKPKQSPNQAIKSSKKDSVTAKSEKVAAGPEMITSSNGDMFNVVKRNPDGTKVVALIIRMSEKSTCSNSPAKPVKLTPKRLRNLPDSFRTEKLGGETVLVHQHFVYLLE